MRVLVSGSNGLVGRALVNELQRTGHPTSLLRRTPNQPDSDHPFWDNFPDQPIDAVVHLAGEPIAIKRWSTQQKQRIRDSRIIGTRQLCEQLVGLANPPEVLVSASAVGYYGDRGDELLDESARRGEGFLADVCHGWETACTPATGAGIRVVNLRIGMVLSSEGGALTKLLPLFKAGLGGKLGHGRQYMSWIAINDLVKTILYVMEDNAISGPVNAVAPNPVRNIEFTKTLGRAVHRPTIFATPALALKLATGEMGPEMLLSSQRAIPKVLADAGFEFATPDLELALSSQLE